MPKRNELIEQGLYGKGLVPVTDHTQVERYNICREEMGLQQTSLERFHIDAMGWSPEIAEELGDEYYHTHGAENPLAIIVTPAQATASIYRPTHSFMWRMFHQWFAVNRDQVIDLTKRHAIWLDIDEDVDLYRTPQDLKIVTQVLVKPYVIGGFMDLARQQNVLLRRFVQESDSHLDEDLVDAVKDSIASVGDLRNENYLIEEFWFGDVQDFFSVTFGGTYVLRSKSETPLIVSQSETEAATHDVLYANSELLPCLEDSGYIELDFAWWKQRLPLLAVLAESFLIDILDRHDVDIDYESMNSGQKKGFVRKFANELHDYSCLMEIASQIEAGATDITVPAHLQVFLYRPASDLSEASAEVVEQLLTFISEGRLVPLFYRHQKGEFFLAYSSWGKLKRQWATKCITKHYPSASKSDGKLHR